MEQEEMVRTVYAYAFSNGRLEILDKYVEPDYVNHNRAPGAGPGLAGLKTAMRGLREAFPDLEYAIDDLVSQADRVAIRATMRGTHLGSFRGIEPTGRRFSVMSLAIVRIGNGRIVERWGLHDSELMAGQLSGEL